MSQGHTRSRRSSLLSRTERVSGRRHGGTSVADVESLEARMLLSAELARALVFVDATVDDADHLTSRFQGGYVASLDLTDNRIYRIMERLEWYSNHQASLQQQGTARQHNRHAPQQAQAVMQLSNGARFPCQILNVSFSGMAIRVPVHVSVGAPIAVGNLKGVVVRAEGADLGIKFSDMMSKTSLDAIVR